MEEQVARAQRDGVLRLLADEEDVRDVLKNKKSYIKTWRNKFRTMKQAMNPEWTDEQKYFSFAVCQDTRKTIVMSPTFFPRCDAFKLVCKTQNLDVNVSMHHGPHPCL